MNSDLGLSLSGSIKQLFDEAKNNGGHQYLYTLLRVQGIDKGPDPITQILDCCKLSVNDASKSQLHAVYDTLIAEDAILCLLSNLHNCCLGAPFQVSPFLELYKIRPVRTEKPPMWEVAKCLVEKCRASGKEYIADIVTAIYPDSLKTWPTREGRERKDILARGLSSMREIIDSYFSVLRKFQTDQKIYRLDNFEVIELLVGKETGLYGFKIYFSNGSSAHFLRTSNGTECVNCDLNDGLGFFVGDLGALKKEWRVGDKRLFEIGLPGRYNPVGEWRPLAYPAQTDHLQKEVSGLSNDMRIQAALFYMRCTGHRGIEFVMRMNINLPQDSMAFGSINIWKCRELEEANTFVYDGWLSLSSSDPMSIEEGINSIGFVANLIGFTYGAKIDWRVKYSMDSSATGFATPSNDDLMLMDQFLRKFPYKGDVTGIFLNALDWHNKGRNTSNPLNGFLCYYIAVELVAHAIADGSIPLGYPFVSGPTTKAMKINCIKALHDALYSDDPIAFVKRAYFECVVGVRKRIEKAVEAVFGTGHAVLKALFEKESDGYSLHDIRNELAHGSMSAFWREHQDLVRNRLPQVASISREFLIRLILNLKSNESVPGWTGLHRLAVTMDDPRATLVVCGPKGMSMISSKSWKIKAAWCD